MGVVFDQTLALSHRVADRLVLWLEDPLKGIPGRLPRLPGDERGFDEDRFRRPVGASIGLTLVVLAVLVVWSLV